MQISASDKFLSTASSVGGSDNKYCVKLIQFPEKKAPSLRLSTGDLLLLQGGGKENCVGMEAQERRRLCIKEEKGGRLKFFLPFHPLFLICVRTYTLRYFSFQFRISATSASPFIFGKIWVGASFMRQFTSPLLPSFYVEGKMCLLFSATFSRQLAKGGISSLLWDPNGFISLPGSIKDGRHENKNYTFSSPYLVRERKSR